MIEPTLAPPTPTATPASVIVTALTPRAAGVPGSTVVLQFRLTSPGIADATVRVGATTERAAWRATLYDADGVTPLVDPVTIPAGATRDVVVTVTVPPEARLTERSETTINVLPIAAG